MPALTHLVQYRQELESMETFPMASTGQISLARLGLMFIDLFRRILSGEYFTNRLKKEPKGQRYLHQG